MLREAIAKTNKVALSRVVVLQRERVVALRPIGDGLVAHTLHEERDLNPAGQYFEDAAGLKIDREMIELAVQLINRQSATYDPADFEDRYETRLRAMIDAMVAGGGFGAEPEEAPVTGNVIDLVVALWQSLAGTAQDASAPARSDQAEDSGKASPVKRPIARGNQETAWPETAGRRRSRAGYGRPPSKGGCRSSWSGSCAGEGASEASLGNVRGRRSRLDCPVPFGDGMCVLIFPHVLEAHRGRGILISREPGGEHWRVNTEEYGEIIIFYKLMRRDTKRDIAAKRLTLLSRPVSAEQSVTV